MHYCQRCAKATELQPEGDLARCPSCGGVVRARRLPVFIVTGASASGKTAILEPLVDDLTGVAAVFDFDWLINPFGHASADGDVDWRSLREAWVAVAHGLAQQGMPMVLLGQLSPDHLAELPNRQWIEGARFLVLDCADDERTRRLDARPAWRGRDVAAQLAWAGFLRDAVETVVRTDEGTIDETAATVASWVRSGLAERGQSDGATTIVNL